MPSSFFFALFLLNYDQSHLMICMRVILPSGWGLWCRNWLPWAKAFRGGYDELRCREKDHRVAGRDGQCCQAIVDAQREECGRLEGKSAALIQKTRGLSQYGMLIGASGWPLV